MRFHQLQPRCYLAAFETEFSRQFHLRHVFKHLQNNFRFGIILSDFPVTMLTRLKNKIIRRNYKPEGLVIHGREPVVNVLYIFEFFHGMRLANPQSQLQILAPKRGRP